MQKTFRTKSGPLLPVLCVLFMLALASTARPLAAAPPTITAGSAAEQTVGPQTPPAPGQPGATIQIYRGSRTNAVVTPRQTTVASTGSRWAELVALLTLVGTVIYRLFIQHDAELPPSVAAESADRARRVALGAIGLFIVATVTRAVAEASLVSSPTSGRMDALLSVIRDTGWGHSWVIGLVGALMMLAGILGGRGSFAGWVVAGIGVAAMATSEALTGHAGASPKHLPLAVSIDVAHVLGAGGWLGGLVALVLCGLPSIQSLSASERPAAGSRLVRAYHRATVDSVTVVIVTGLVAAWLRLGSFPALWASPYGTMLTRKLVFVAFLIGLVLYHWRIAVTPDWDDDTKFRFQRSATIELLVGGAVVALTALLIGMNSPAS